MELRSLPSLSALRAFEALAQTRSFSKAGALLNVTHAAISQHIRALEADLGVQLVRREGRTTSLTAEGTLLAGALLASFSAIADVVEELRAGHEGRPLQVTVTPAFAVRWLMPRITDFHHASPGVELMLNPTAELVELRPGGVDVAIRFGTGHWPGLQSKMLLPSSLAIVAARSLVHGRTFRDPSEMLEMPWLQEYGTNEISNWMRKRGVITPRPEKVTHLPGYLVLEALFRGQGVSPIARALVEQEISDGSLEVLFEDEIPGTGYHIVTRPGIMRPASKSFVRWLQKHASPASSIEQEISGRLRSSAPA
jgi:LysR family transcriptional regulator, glycine cleavage system transcriptional activator